MSLCTRPIYDSARTQQFKLLKYRLTPSPKCLSKSALTIYIIYFCSYNYMIQCWKDNPSDRPKFTELRQQFEHILQEDNPYMDFSTLDNNKDYYMVPSFNSAADENSASSLHL
jgi:hypothetical protein